MTLNELLAILIRMNQNTEVDGDTEVVIEYDGPDTRKYLPIEHISFNQAYNQIEIDARVD